MVYPRGEICVDVVNGSSTPVIHTTNIKAAVVNHEASPNDKKDTSSFSTLIVFFSFQNPSQELQGLTDEELIAFAYTRYAYPSSTIALLIDDANRVQASQKLFEYLRVHVHTFNTRDPRLESFDRAYKHSSVNDRFYEAMCFKRFFLLHSLVQDISMNYKIDRVVMPDTDIIMLSHDLIPQLGTGIDAWKPLSMVSYFTVFTPHALADYCDFILDFFRQKSEQFFNDILHYGGGPELHEHTVREWMPNYNKTSMKPLQQFSDMHLSRVWSDRTKLHVEIQGEQWIPNVNYYFQSCCLYPSGGIFNMDWRVTSSDSRTVEYAVSIPNRTGEYLKGLHFQGKSKKHVCLAMCPYLFPMDKTFIPCCKEQELNLRRKDAP